MVDIPISPLTLICVGSSAAFSRLFYHLYQQKKLELQKIQEIKKFQPNEDLFRTLKASPQKRLQYVAVEGLVQADGEPLASRYVPRCFGVIQKVVVQECWEMWNPTMKSWNPRKMNTKETMNTVPFSLVCPTALVSKVTVNVSKPLEAKGSFLEQVYHRLLETRQGAVDSVVQELSGERPVGLEESEELLRVGTTLTCFGEVVLDQGRMLKLQPPMDGRQYLLVSTDYQSFLQRHQNTATMWKVLSFTFGLAGSALLGWALIPRQDGKRARN